MQIYAVIKKVEKYNVIYEIKSLTSLIVRNFFENDKDMCDGEIKSPPTPTQVRTIEYLVKHNNEAYQKELERELDVRRATISGVLQTMEKNGLIERVADENDSRAKRVILNQKATNFFEKNKKKMDEISYSIIEGIPEEELQIFANVITKMKANLNAN